MKFPAFFSQVPTLLMRDRLAKFLGAAGQGLIEHGSADAVKLAGIPARPLPATEAFPTVCTVTRRCELAGNSL